MNIELRDYFGTLRSIPEQNLYQYFATSGFTLYGMNLKSILQLRTEYLTRGGKLPITPESTKALIRQTATQTP